MKKFTVEFVEHLPRPLGNGVLYVSIRFRITAHNCPCGCGSEVVTNLSPTGWRLTFDGETVSLYPSIGNWDLPCRSHYWIKHSAVQWASRWTDEEIALAKFQQGHTANHPPPEKIHPSSAQPSRRRRIWGRLFGG